MSESERALTLGTLYAVVGFLIWGVLPLYWRWLGSVPAAELLAHRVVWASGTLAPIVLVLARSDLRVALRDSRAIGIAAVAGVLLGANWFIYIWAISVDRLVEASLGYYINPLVNVFLGVLFLRERLSRIQVGALLLAIAGVLVLSISHGQFPWISVALGFSFGIYGLVKKVGRLGSLVGLFVEMWLIAPVAAIYLAALARRGEASFASGNPLVTILLAAAGVVTIAPLLLFGVAARRIPLSRVGFLQYLAPTTMLVIGTVVFGEPFTVTHVISFACIWAALGLYSASLVQSRRASRNKSQALSQET